VSVVDAGTDDDVLTVAQLKERARILDGDADSDALVQSYITAARLQVERDTGFALPKQTLAVSFDQAVVSLPYRIPMPPLQDVTSVIYTDSAGNATDLDLNLVIAQIDRVSRPGRVIFTADAFAGLAPPVSVQALGFVVTAGFTAATMPEALRFAVGLLASHYLTAGRDRTVIGTSVLPMPAGYDEVIDAYKLQVLV